MPGLGWIQACPRNSHCHRVTTYGAANASKSCHTLHAIYIAPRYVKRSPNRNGMCPITSSQHKPPRWGHISAALTVSEPNQRRRKRVRDEDRQDLKFHHDWKETNAACNNGEGRGGRQGGGDTLLVKRADFCEKPRGSAYEYKPGVQCFDPPSGVLIAERRPQTPSTSVAL